MWPPMTCRSLSERSRPLRTCCDISRESLDDKARDYLERMQRAAERMQALVQDLLRYSRVSSKAEPFTRFNLGNAVKRR